MLGRTELEYRRGGKAQKSYGHNQSSADKEACNPVFPPIRPGKADYSIPGLFLACSLSPSLCHSPSIVAGGQGLLFLEMCVHVIWLVLFNASEEWATIVTVWPFSLPLSGPIFDSKLQSRFLLYFICNRCCGSVVGRCGGEGELCLLICVERPERCPRTIYYSSEVAANMDLLPSSIQVVACAAMHPYLSMSSKLCHSAH